jgi:uncharacterized membrane protein
MKQNLAIKIIFVISILGLAFSGFLTYQELFVSTSGASCPTPGAPGTVFGYPACVYGFVMYLIIFIISGLGLLHKKNN